MRDQLRTTWLVAEFFTHSYRISGSVDVRSRKLADQLNDQSSDFLQLEDAYVSSIEHAADIIASHASSVLRKDKVIAVATSHPEEGLSRQQSYGSYLGTYLTEVFLLVPSFEIQGFLRLTGKMDLRRALTTAEDFATLLDGRMRASTDPDIEFTGGAILVNKSYVETFWVKNDG